MKLIPYLMHLQKLLPVFQTILILRVYPVQFQAERDRASFFRLESDMCESWTAWNLQCLESRAYIGRKGTLSQDAHQRFIDPKIVKSATIS